MENIIIDTLKSGGPFAISVLLFYMWREERRDKTSIREAHEQLQSKVLENAVVQTQATTKMEGAITALKDVLTQFLASMHGG